MPTGRITVKRLPISPGQDSRFSIRHNPHQGNQWWVYYKPQGSDPIPADADHAELVARVNRLKTNEGNAAGGPFSINEHRQVIARMKAPAGYTGHAVHVVDVSDGAVYSYSPVITFQNGALRPDASPPEGTPWPGPLCGTSYTFPMTGAVRPPSNLPDDIRIEIDGTNVQLSSHCGIHPYPPASGPLASFLAALRRQLSDGGRFRVNEIGRAFCSDEDTGNLFIGTIPLVLWFRAIRTTD